VVLPELGFKHDIKFMWKLLRRAKIPSRNLFSKVVTISQICFVLNRKTNPIQLYYSLTMFIYQAYEYECHEITVDKKLHKTL
jgi:hypothetical protein